MNDYVGLIIEHDKALYSQQQCNAFLLNNMRKGRKLNYIFIGAIAMLAYEVHACNKRIAELESQRR